MHYAHSVLFGINYCISVASLAIAMYIFSAKILFTE